MVDGMISGVFDQTSFHFSSTHILILCFFSSIFLFLSDSTSPVDPSPEVTAPPPPPVVAKRKAKELKDPSPTATAAASSSTSSSDPKPASKYKKRTKREDRVPLQWSEISIPAQARVDQINSILGGDQWKSQQIGGLGVIPSRNEHSLNGLRKCVEAGTPGFVKEDVKSKRSKKKKDPVASGSGSGSGNSNGNANANANANGGSNGLFHEDIVEALIRAFDMRSRKERELGGGAYFELGASDFNQAAQLLEEKKKNGGEYSAGIVQIMEKYRAFRVVFPRNRDLASPLPLTTDFCLSLSSTIFPNPFLTSRKMAFNWRNRESFRSTIYSKSKRSIPIKGFRTRW